MKDLKTTINVNLTVGLIQELDEIAKSERVSRSDAIRKLLRLGIDYARQRQAGTVETGDDQ